MNKVQETYLELLKVAIWGGELTSEGVKEKIVRDESRKELTNERVNDVIRLAAFQGTASLVYNQLLKLKDVEIPDALRMQMKQQCVMSMMQQNSTIPILKQAWDALEEAGIHPVLLKGFALAQYYPQPHLRQWGDIDLYVGQKQYHQACAVLCQTFPDIPHPEEDDEERKHYNFDFDNTAIETHRISMAFAHPRDRRYYEKLEERCLTKDGPKFEIEGLEVTMPEETFNVFFVFLHAWHHFVETGMSMKQLCDIAILLHAKHEVINKDRLHEMLQKLQLLEVWQLIMWIILKYLGVPKEECPFSTEKSNVRAQLLFAHILKEGASYRHEEINAKGASYLKRKWLTFQSRLDDSKRVRPFAPRYAHHMVVSDFVHGLERMLKGKKDGKVFDNSSIV